MKKLIRNLFVVALTVGVAYGPTAVPGTSGAAAAPAARGSPVLKRTNSAVKGAAKDALGSAEEEVSEAVLEWVTTNAQEIASCALSQEQFAGLLDLVDTLTPAAISALSILPTTHAVGAASLTIKLGTKVYKFLNAEFRKLREDPCHTLKYEITEEPLLRNPYEEEVIGTEYALPTRVKHTHQLQFPINLGNGKSLVLQDGKIKIKASF